MLYKFICFSAGFVLEYRGGEIIYHGETFTVYWNYDTERAIVEADPSLAGNILLL